jgi:hypothetical protein
VDRMESVDNSAPPTAAVNKGPAGKGKEKEEAEKEREREKDRERERAAAAAAKAQLIAQVWVGPLGSVGILWPVSYITCCGVREILLSRSSRKKHQRRATFHLLHRPLLRPSPSSPLPQRRSLPTSPMSLHRPPYATYQPHPPPAAAEITSQTPLYPPRPPPRVPMRRYLRTPPVRPVKQRHLRAPVSPRQAASRSRGATLQLGRAGDRLPLGYLRCLLKLLA